MGYVVIAEVGEDVEESVEKAAGEEYYGCSDCRAETDWS